MSRLVQIEPEFDISHLIKLVKDKVIPGAASRDQNHQFSLSIFQELHKAGWIQAFIPETLGGPGFKLPDLIHIAKELAYGSAGVFTSSVINMLGMSPLILYGSEPLKKKLTSEFLREFTPWSYCMTEPDTGSDIFHSKTTAVRVEDGYVLNGKKCFITNANISKHLCVFASLQDCDELEHPLTAFYLPASSPGVSRGKPLKKMGQRDSDTGELFFENVFIPDNHRIGKEGQGLAIAFHSLQRSKIMIAAAAIGMCHRALHLVEDHLANRVLYQNPLLSIPQIQSQLSHLHTEVTAAWLLTCHAAGAWSEKTPAIKEASMAKMFATDVAVRLVSEVVELFGGYGYSMEFEIERLYRDVRVLEIYEGPTLVQLALISRQLYPTLRPSQVRDRSKQKDLRKAA